MKNGRLTTAEKQPLRATIAEIRKKKRQFFL